MLTTLKFGDRNTDVVKLQKLLNKKLLPYPNLVEDGKFGRNTYRAVKTFQQYIGLEENGIVDFWTWIRLYLTSKALTSVNGINAQSIERALPQGPSGNKTTKTSSTTNDTHGTQGLLDLQKAVDWINNNAQQKSLGKCAKYVRLALEAGGGDTSGHPISAKNWGPTLIKMGFKVVSDDGYIAEFGDVVIFQPPANASTKHGHIQMFNGSCWVSDFFQKNFRPNRREKTQYTIYRYASKTNPN